MSDNLQPDDVLKAAKKGQVAPFYLFYGPGEFRMERVLATLKTLLVPEAVRDLNLEVLYGDDKIGEHPIQPEAIINKASSMPFLAQRRLIILRRTESFTADQIERFVPYLENPSSSTCLIFLSSKTNFNTRFYKKFRSEGVAVLFDELKGKQIVPWIKKTASEDLGMTMDGEACAYLHAIMGNRPREIYSELEKLYLRYGKTVSLDQVKEAVIHSRVYTIFELMDAVSIEGLRFLPAHFEEIPGRRGPEGCPPGTHQHAEPADQAPLADQSGFTEEGGNARGAEENGTFRFPGKEACRTGTALDRKGTGERPRATGLVRRPSEVRIQPQG